MDFLTVEDCHKMYEVDSENYVRSLWAFYREHTPKALMKADLKCFSKRIESLVRCVSDIHQSEENREIQTLLESNIDVRSVFEALKGDHDTMRIFDSECLVRAKGIYCLESSEIPVFFVGDIHSDPKSLRRILKRMDFFHRIRENQRFKVVFLGDYIDRGRCHLELIESLLTLKALYRNHIILLRGNHDGGILLENGEIELAYKLDPGSKADDYFPLYLKHLSAVNPTFNVSILSDFLDFFRTLGHCALIQNREKRVMAVHGGLPRPMLSSMVSGADWYAHLNTLMDFVDEHELDHLGNGKRHNMMWSDPAPTMIDGSAPDLREDKRRFRFSCEQFMAFKERTGIMEIVRGHQAVIEGHRIQCGGVHTLFSSGSLEESDEESGDLTATAYGGVTPKILQLDGKGQWHVISLKR